MTRKLTTAEFIERAKKVHGDRYDYSMTVYSGYDKNLKIVCPDHSDYMQLPSNHLRGSGCPKCAPKKKTAINVIIAEARKIHGDRYDYTKAKYAGNCSKTTITCPIHGDFDQVVYTHLSGHGCPECAGNLKGNTEEFIRKAMKIHGEKYNYSEVAYVNSKTPVSIICPRHGIFKQAPYNHLTGQGCRKCGIESRVRKQSLTKDKFIETARSVHGELYDYSRVDYVNSMRKVIIICPTHGEFSQRPSRHCAGDACPKCAPNKKLTQDEFIDRARAIHGNKYDYSHVSYKNVDTPVEIICPIHGRIKQRPNDHLQGKGCRACSGALKLTNEVFIKRARKVHGKQYDYSLVRYIDSKSHVTIICRTHGEFQQKPNHHLRGIGCPSCGGTQRLTTEGFIDRARKVHGSKYDYSKVDYKTQKVKVTIICPEHGEFNQSPNDHLNGCGCGGCSLGGFNPLDPAILYYIRIETRNHLLWKIGISNNSVEERFPRDLRKITVIQTWPFDDGVEAYEAEQDILREYAEYRYKRRDMILSGGGNTELFSHDVLGLDSEHEQAS